MTVFVLTVFLPVSWIAVSALSVGFTIPLVRLRRSLARTAMALTADQRVTINHEVAALITIDDRRAVEIRLMILVTFMIFGFSALLLPAVISRILFTVLLYLDNAALGYKSFREYQTLRRSILVELQTKGAAI